MMTLREFLKVIRDEHFRVYQPNRDWLIFESYFKIHSPYYFGSHSERTKGELHHNHDYYDNNDYCQNFYRREDGSIHYDEETEYFLEEFGNYEVFRLESSGFTPLKMYTDDSGLHLEPVEDKYRPGAEYIDCFNVFIIPYTEDKECSRCWHSNYYNGKYASDNDDAECKNCRRNNDEQASL